MSHYGHLPQPHRAEESVGSLQGEVLEHAHAGVVDIGAEVDVVVAVERLVHVLLQQLVRGEVGRLLGHPEVGVHDVRHVRHPHCRREI